MIRPVREHAQYLDPGADTPETENCVLSAMTSQHVCYKLHFEKKQQPFAVSLSMDLMHSRHFDTSQQEIHRCFNY